MSDVTVNSVKPSEVGPEAIAYFLTASILAGEGYGSKGYNTGGAGIPMIHGCTEEEILRTYAKALRIVKKPWDAAGIIAA